ncbi:MAG: dihydropteroate synthase [Pseudomonadota bacterium]
MRLLRPLTQTGEARPDGAVTLAGGWCWFDHVEVLRGGSGVIPVSACGAEELAPFTAPREAICGLDFARPHLMGILNVTPDSFSDGGLHATADTALAAGKRMAGEGVSILDVGGESTRPGAIPVPEPDEITRVMPVIAALRAHMPEVPVSIDTRNALVAEAALKAGAGLFNDVSALTHDPESLAVAARTGAPVCLMHAQGDPRTMQDAPLYADVVGTIYDYLERRVQECEAAGIPRSRLIVDPGIGFGKTLEHNLTLLKNLSVFHGLGCVILLGASRKRFIGTLGGAPEATDRAPGSIAVGLEALRQGVQIVRVHDTAQTAQALALWTALTPLR